MIVDAHIHCSGQENCADVLQALDEARVDVGVLLAPFLSGDYRLGDVESLRRANRYLGKLVHGQSDRLFGFAVINPAAPPPTTKPMGKGTCRHAPFASSR